MIIALKALGLLILLIIAALAGAALLAAWMAGALLEAFRR